ncbi:hypothetical protein ARMGADRAFT_1079818 [Armillaria gallica]|uniref:Uncharacterized protein n=1 Tax=Armillaria gallica TaxID=47427 RepID=A0A2H3E1B9_ARMGA|nr:hypothetical protein ARMGADRAFT_1079818 [Armillaria gallica]
MLDSYNQHWFGGTIPDERITLEERITDLSRDLPAMPLWDGSYPACAPDNCPMVDILDGVGPMNDNPTNDRKSLNSVQTARLFMERQNRRLCHPGRLPAWLNRFGLTYKQDNSFRGMYGLGFTYDPCTNTMYTDREAVEAAQALAEGLEYSPTDTTTTQPNPRGFLMNIQEVQETVTYIHMRQPGWQSTLRLISEFNRISEAIVLRYRDLAMHKVIESFERDHMLQDLRQGMRRPYFIELDDRYQVTSRGSMANRAGLPDPVNGTLDDWCQYTAHHFCPGGMNPAGGIIMDTSHCISYTSVWGMVLLRVLHPTGAKNYYGRYLAGIIFRPRFYSDYI